MVSNVNKCQYCLREFRKELNFTNHKCEKMLRHKQKDSREVQLGFQGFLHFYKKNQKSRKAYTYDDFVKSPYYRAFVSWGKYVIDLKSITPEAFLNWLLDNNKKIDQWTSDKNYDLFLLSYLKQEPISDALRRAIETSDNWSNKTSMKSCDMLRYGNTNSVIYTITTGGISPWILYNSNSGQDFLNKLEGEQLDIIFPYINPDEWNKVFDLRKDDQKYLQDMLKTLDW